MEELFDITDENGFVTGQTVTRSEAHDKGIMYRTAHIWIVRKSGDSYQVLLQKRSVEKESFPLMYDTSSAGHIQAGDEPLESAQREVIEGCEHRDGTFCVPTEGLETVMRYLGYAT